ncbi:hypothetical protein [Nocardia cyriacigeorgica]|uniref:hypothetical protein n=1 Tax=Nocardia cyriacigeorgica TaxID=135487 RepID=UPI0018934DF1|nr:hypothetical protein [Nocardia cyriacigeorgica]MBF6455264.1 hypothetical protein [Nocardia cyriacigeorgica]MBF6553994.1 hypothetical protein [Nocardia cyriacigeorgica]
MDMQPVIDSAERLTDRGEWFVSTQCVRVESPRFDELGDRWLQFGIPATQVDRMLDFQRRWGGLVLPPYGAYEGGPKMLCCEMPAEQPERVGWFYAGLQRASMAYSFMIGPAGEFAIDGGPWVSLHASIEGWIESVALAHHATLSARQITTIRGEAIDELPPRDFEPVPEVRGLADTWWRGPDSLIAIHTGEAVGFDQPRLRLARIYDGDFVRRL